MIGPGEIHMKVGSGADGGGGGSGEFVDGDGGESGGHWSYITYINNKGIKQQTIIFGEGGAWWR
jgi:hypothetical protein